MNIIATSRWTAVRERKMRLTLFTDYAMRVLFYLAVRPDRLCSIAEVARAHHISLNHLTKIVSELARAGCVESIRGRGGGIRLGKPPEEINVGALIRHIEGGFALVDCGSCVIAPACGLTGVLEEALTAFTTVLDRYSLADLMDTRQHMLRRLTEGSR
jgi:Rrf2 family nitric oxide-sensitive transcriptional repressor